MRLYYCSAIGDVLLIAMHLKLVNSDVCVVHACNKRLYGYSDSKKKKNSIWTHPHFQKEKSSIWTHPQEDVAPNG